MRQLEYNVTLFAMITRLCDVALAETDELEAEQVDPDVAAMMGFSGFGTK